MKQFVKASTSLLVVFMLFVAMCFTNASAATGTGYTKAGDVKYEYYSISSSSKSYSVNNGVKNWGARGEACVFLSPNASKYYTGNNTFDKLSKLKGGTTQTNSPGTALYEALQDLMDISFEHNYKKTRDLFQYTDCVMNQTSKLVSFYSGTLVNSAWDSGDTYNREHCWPDSKCLNPGRESGDSADMMILRPTAPSENGSRGNKAYGESSGYFVPNDEVKGDCARIVLYGYVRYGNTSNMWGKSGVMENMTVLLKWMQQDPVDTWEMGRNDAVESISGNRNVFVDYPEYAWLLFGKSVPTNMTTPSGEAKGGINPGTENGGSTGSNTGNNTSSSTSSSTSTGNSTSSKNDTVTSSNGTSSDYVSSSTSGVGAIDNKPQNEGKPFDPSNLGGTTTLVEDEGSTFSAWMIIVPVAVVLAAVIAVAVVIIIRQKKVK